MSDLEPPIHDPLEAVGEAFSRKAALYDEFGQDHPNLERMRMRVRKHIERFLPDQGRVLELNAGTGADAVYFAKRGHSVLATDIAPGMLAAIREKTSALGLADRLKTADVSFTELDRLEDGPFDHIFSNMGGLNCTPELSAVARHLPALLAKRGRVTWVIMPRICPWEWTALIKGDRKTATRRLRRDGIGANVEGVTVPTWYFSAGEAAAAFGPEFKRIQLENLSFLTPPADHKAFAIRRPRLYSLLAALDARVSGLPLVRGWGDFFILTMQWTP